MTEFNQFINFLFKMDGGIILDTPVTFVRNNDDSVSIIFETDIKNQIPFQIKFDNDTGDFLESGYYL